MFLNIARRNAMKILQLSVIGLLAAANPAFSADEQIVRLTVADAVKIAIEENLGIKMNRAEARIAGGALTARQGAFDTVIDAAISDAESRTKSAGLAGVSTSRNNAMGWSVSASRMLDTGTQLTASAAGGRTDFKSSPLSPDPAYSSSLALGVSQPLLKGKGRDVQTAGIRAAEMSVQAAGMTVEHSTAELAANVKRAYWELVFALDDIEVKKLSLQLAERLRSETQQKIEAGALAPVEIYQPESEAALRDQELIASERNASAAEDALKLAMNVREWNRRIVPADTPDESAKDAIDTDAAISDALENRRDIRAAERRAEAARYLLGSAADARRPELALSGGLAFNGLSGSATNSVTESDYGWNVALNYRVPLENRAASGAYASAMAEEEKANLASMLLRQAVVKEVRDAARNAKVAGRTIDAAQKTSLAFRKRMEAEQSKFDVGLSTASDVLNAQTLYARALSGEKRALVDYAQALAELERVRGAR